MRRLNKIRTMLGWKWVQNMLKSRIEKKVKGPNLKRRESSPTLVWGEVLNDKGDVLTGRITTANGYALTVTGSLGIVEYLLKTEEQHSGYKTASALMGADYVCSLPGSSEFTIS